MTNLIEAMRQRLALLYKQAERLRRQEADGYGDLDCRYNALMDEIGALEEQLTYLEKGDPNT